MRRAGAYLGRSNAGGIDLEGGLDGSATCGLRAVVDGCCCVTRRSIFVRRADLGVNKTATKKSSRLNILVNTHAHMCEIGHPTERGR